MQPEDLQSESHSVETILAHSEDLIERSRTLGEECITLRKHLLALFERSDALIQMNRETFERWSEISGIDVETGNGKSASGR